MTQQAGFAFGPTGSGTGSVAEALLQPRMDMSQVTHDIAASVVHRSDRTMPTVTEETRRELEAFTVSAGLEEDWADDWKGMDIVLADSSTDAGMRKLIERKLAEAVMIMSEMRTTASTSSGATPHAAVPTPQRPRK